MLELFEEKKFRGDNARVVQACIEITEEYMEQGYELTVRQLYYQMIAQDLFPESWVDEDYNFKHELDPYTKNTVKNYQRLVKLVSAARMAGLIDWDAIVDRVRETERNTHWGSHDEILEAMVNSWAIDKWADQDCHIEVMCEKDAVAGIVAPVCRKLDIAFTACRGYASQTLLYKKGKELRGKILDEKKDVGILYLGDHDPSGLDMDRDLRSRLAQFIGCTEDSFVFFRLGLTKGQIEDFNPPPNPAKATDSRFKQYSEIHGYESWELDALKPQVLEALVTGAVKKIRNEERWKAAVEREKEMRAGLMKRVGLEE